MTPSTLLSLVCWLYLDFSLSPCSKWGDECVCLSKFLLIVWSRAEGVMAKEGWDLSIAINTKSVILQQLIWLFFMLRLDFLLNNVMPT